MSYLQAQRVNATLNIVSSKSAKNNAFANVSGYLLSALGKYRTACMSELFSSYLTFLQMFHKTNIRERFEKAKIQSIKKLLLRFDRNETEGMKLQTIFYLSLRLTFLFFKAKNQNFIVKYVQCAQKVYIAHKVYSAFLPSPISGKKRISPKFTGSKC